MNLKFNPMQLRRRVHKSFFLGKDERKEIINSRSKSEKQIISEIEEFAKNYFDVKYAIFTASGKSAIELILKSIRIKKDDELITQAWQCYETLKMISSHCKIKFSDVEKGTFNSDFENFKKALTKNTKVVMPVNLYGFTRDIAEIAEFCKKNKIFFLEDCAHSFGASSGKRKLGTFGNASIFSFSKSLASLSGGLVLTNDSLLASRIIEARKKQELENNKLALNVLESANIFIMTYMNGLNKIFPASLFLEKMHSNARNSGDAEYYKVSLSKSELSVCLSQMRRIDKINEHYIYQYSTFYSYVKKIQGISIFKYQEGSNALRFPILFDKEVDIQAFLRYIYLKGSFEPSLNYNQEYELALKLNPSNLPNLDFLKKRLVVFPLDNLSREDLFKLRDLIVEYLNNV